VPKSLVHLFLVDAEGTRRHRQRQRRLCRAANEAGRQDGPRSGVAVGGSDPGCDSIANTSTFRRGLRSQPFVGISDDQYTSRRLDFHILASGDSNHVEGSAGTQYANCLWAAARRGRSTRELDGSVNVVTTIGGGALLGLALDAERDTLI